MSRLLEVRGRRGRGLTPCRDALWREERQETFRVGKMEGEVERPRRQRCGHGYDGADHDGDGGYAALIDRYFGNTAATLSRRARVTSEREEQLCSGRAASWPRAMIRT